MPNFSRALPFSALTVAASALALAGCGSDDTATPAAAASTPAAAGAAGQQSTDTSMAGAAVDGKITVKATEFMFSPMDITASAGKLTITMENDGNAPHELVVLKTDAAADSLEATDGRVSEKDSVGEVSETEGGQSKSTTLDLKPGKYVIVCNVPGHYMKGMRGTLTVS